MQGLLASIAVLLVLGACLARSDDDAGAALAVNDLMITVITPATDTLWGIEDPQTDAEWQVFIDAADTVIEAGTALKSGGAGPNDDTWAADPAWQAFTDRLLDAARAARTAAENRDVEAMFSAGEVLYPPCEECHLSFHPGMQGDP